MADSPSDHRYVYAIEAPGRDLHGEDTPIRAKDLQDAEEQAARRAQAWNLKLHLVGERIGDRLVVFEDSARFFPWWAREEADEEHQHHGRHDLFGDVFECYECYWPGQKSPE